MKDNFIKNKEKDTLYSYYELGVWTTQLLFQKVLSQNPNYKKKSLNESISFFRNRINEKLSSMNILFLIDYDNINSNIGNEIMKTFSEPKIYLKEYTYRLGQNVMFWLFDNITIHDDGLSSYNNHFVEEIFICLKALDINDTEALKCFVIEDCDCNSKEQFDIYIQKKFGYFNQLIEMYLKKIVLYYSKEQAKISKIEYEYDIALSFAGEDREYVDIIANELKSRGMKVFYDKFEVSNLWGKDLYQYLSHIYKDNAKFCVIFVSQNYKNKAWTMHELKNAQNRAFHENKEYILPIYLEDVELDGLNDTIGYIKASEFSESEIADLIIEKVNEI